MVDMASISAAVTGLKTATDIAKGLMELKTATDIQGKVIELQAVILAAQSSAIAAQSDQFTLLEKVRELKDKMAELEAWETEKKRYQLTDYGGGTFAYGLKAEAAGGEPLHRICANCYQQGKKRILQFKHSSEGQDYYQCAGCNTEFVFGIYQYRPLPPAASDFF